MPKVYFPILAAFLEVVVMQLYNMSTNHTVWKFENFSFTQILCEINFAVSRVNKIVILMVSLGLNCDL